MVAVLAMSVQVVPSGELCHLVMLPVWPLNVSMELLVPVQTVALPAMLPPTEIGLTLIVIELVLIQPLLEVDVAVYVVLVVGETFTVLVVEVTGDQDHTAFFVHPNRTSGL